MPNGGSDCCGTCWFNAKNKGEAGYGHTKDPGPDFCAIRGIAIEDAFYTYCANHPHRSPERNPNPVGPVYTGDDHGNRTVLIALPDTPENRKSHMELLSRVDVRAAEEYPLGLPLCAVVIDQLAEWGEVRAIPELERIHGLPWPRYDDFVDGVSSKVVEAAAAALEKLKRMRTEK